MQFVRVVPLLLIMLVAFLLGLVAWGFWRTRAEDVNDMPMTPRDDVLLGFLMLAAVALVIFLAYALLGLH